MMFFFKMLSQRLRNIHNFSKQVLILSVVLMIALYISAGASYLMAPYVPEYLRAMTMFHGAMEAAPATFAAGVCAALISDMALARDPKGTDDKEDDD